MRTVRQSLGVVVAAAVSSPAYAGCEPLAIADLARMEVETELALESLDSARLKALGATVRTSLPCLEEVMEPAIAGRVHRILGFASYVGGSLDQAKRHFMAARAADPAYAIPPVVLVETHPLRELFESSDPPEAPRRVELPAPWIGELRVDGVVSTTAPAELPSVIQHIDVTGAPTATGLVEPGGAPPTYATKAPDEEPGAPPKRTPRADLLLGTVVFDAPPDAIGTLVYGGLSAGLEVPVSGPVVLTARLGAAWTPLRDEWNVEHNLPLAWTPHVGVGLGFDVTDGEGPQLTPGLQAIASAAAGEGLLPGVAGVVDARLPAGPIALAADVRVGWAGAPLVGVGVGVGF